MKQASVFRIVYCIGMLMLSAASARASGPIGVSFRDTTIVAGKQIDYPVYVDSSVTGLNVTSYQMVFTYNNTILTLVGIFSDSSLTSGWGQPLYNIVSPGKLSVAGAGAAPLSGKGKLIWLRFAIAPLSYYSSAGFNFQSLVLNQGTPAVTSKNGTISVTPIPSITISPNTWLMAKGESKQFTVSGGTPPYTWSLTNSSPGSVSPAGLFTASQSGLTKLIVTDSAGYVDTSGIVDVRPFLISVHDTSKYQGQWVNLPVYVTDVTGLGIVSGQFSLSYNQNLWTPESLITTGTLIQTMTPAPLSFGQGKINISFAGTTPIGGSGILLYLRLKAATSTYGSSNFSFQNCFFNESFFPMTKDGNVSVLSLTPVSVSPSYAQTMVAGEMLQFTASGGTLPYQWSVSDTALASISAAGMVKAKRSGTATVSAKDSLGAIGTSGAISIYDFRFSMPDTSLLPASIVDIPLYVSPNAVGFSSFQMNIQYTTGSYVQLLDIINAGTLTAGWSIDRVISSGSATLAGAGVNSITAGGVLFKLRFAVPDSTPRPSTIYVTLSNVVFDQGTPKPLTDNGYFTIANNAVFSITPASGTVQSPAMNTKDSIHFTVHNSGTAVLTSSLGINGSGEFTLSKYNLSIPSMDSAVITLFYLPTNGGKDTAAIHFNSNDPYHSSVNVQVIGTLLIEPLLTLNTASINFGTVHIGNFKDTTVTISNTGSDTLKITSISSADPAFTIRAPAVVVPPGSNFVDTIRFTPSAASTITGVFLIVSNAGTSPDTIHFSGTGDNPLSAGESVSSPGEFSLGQNYPNPFNPTTTLRFSVPTSGKATLKIFNSLGMEIATLYDGEAEAGEYHVVQFNAAGFASGIYFSRLEHNGKIQLRKMLLVK